MSVYKLIEVSKTSEKETTSIYDKDDINQAIINMHNDFGVIVKQGLTIGAYCLIINNETGECIDIVQWGEPMKERVYTHNNYTDDNISAYDTQQLAIGNYHTKLASQRTNANCSFAITIRIGSKGEFNDSDVWNRQEGE